MTDLESASTKPASRRPSRLERGSHLAHLLSSLASLAHHGWRWWKELGLDDVF